MELKLEITHKAKGYRAGKLFVNGKFFGYTIEDEDRGLKQSMTKKEIAAIKKYGITAIPTGRYEVAFTYSNRFKRFMMQLLNVPGYEGIRIHVANTAKDVEGCIGVAYEDSSDGFAGNSRKAMKDLEAFLRPISKTEKIFITIE
jgi:hypothetical protein